MGVVTDRGIDPDCRVVNDRFFLHQEWDYPSPVFVGDTVTAEAEVIDVRADKPITRLRCVARRQDGTEVLRGECLVYTMRPMDPSVG